MESHEFPVKSLHECLDLFRKIEAVVNKFRGNNVMVFTNESSHFKSVIGDS